MRDAADVAPAPGAFPDPGGTAAGRAALLADLLALAAEWGAGRMPLAVLAAQMTPFERYGARRAQPLDGSDDDLLLRRLFEALCRDGRSRITHQGLFTFAERDEWRARHEAARQGGDRGNGRDRRRREG